MYRHAVRTAKTGLIVLVAVALTACDIAVDGHGGLSLDMASGKAQDEWKRTYKVGTGGRFEIININGQIVAEAGDGDEVEVLAQRSVKASNDERARDLLSKLEMREEVGDSRVRVEVRVPRLSGWSQTITWTIRVPKGLAVDLRTTNGGVKLTNLDGNIRARATNGGVTGTGLTATNLDAAVTNGGVDITVASVPEGSVVDLESTNGGVTLTLPGDSKADITARCVNGGIAVNGLSVEVLGEQTKRHLEGKLNGGGARISLETVNGGVRLNRTTT
jgi:hypothetical protein